MRIKGKKGHVKRASCFARALDVYEFDLRIKRGSCSYCIRHEDGSFTIALQKGLGKYWDLRHLAHEMTHLAQYLRGDLKDVSANGIVWKGEMHTDCSYMSDGYYLSPWEMEARGMEEYLTHKWENRKSELH